ncbi:MAG: hypothetical protein A2937_04135 [Candidatus Yonathbacteria bacterium RIFCSPLOWO2_01_FULL_47_33b]|uniref:Uncharacterized protein n=1 Tax=Candidatus Yonathbacteria bacterium RIFCSPLOWO2_01_FULL_47_33b TaxID=1802727 RepID=A0A1G2SFT3_9BACT|nr:MAG: hypothetical protein A2937_04135 [Candidatus Yonathbacteria bacterium RIFCSPLOWO2_01_FULL_47_33b]
MSEVLSSKEVDMKLAEIAHQMVEQLNDRDHHLARGHDGLMVCADRHLYRLRIEWDKTLLLQGVTCERDQCRKTSSIAEWKFFCENDKERLIETSKVRCPWCGWVTATSEHPMLSRIAWVVSHAYALPEDFLPDITYDSNVFCSKTSVPG